VYCVTNKIVQQKKKKQRKYLVLVDTVVIANQMDDAFDDRINTLETTF
jgi:type I site-specific restriction-modification system R (restriction) subunit